MQTRSESLFNNATAQTAGADEALTVSALNRLARTALERSFPLLRVCGEISNLTRAASGHLYFTLKDEQAQVRCTMWRSRAQLLAFRPENGSRVEARAQVTLYEPRGDFQLSIETLRPGGTGNLFEAFLRLKEKLAGEGLFDPAVKRPVPNFPQRIGIVTSLSAAALQDVLATLRRRAPSIELILYPSPVQGDMAPRLLLEALRTASSRSAHDRIDVVLLVRGGGSIEDLQAFNDEPLARAIRACAVPVISGIGHETDFTIADFAADVRAATPTGAAELASAGYYEVSDRLVMLSHRLRAGFESRLNTGAQRLDQAAVRLVHPRDRLRRSSDTVGQLSLRLSAVIGKRLDRETTRCGMLELRFRAERPDLLAETTRCGHLAERLRELGNRLIERRVERIDGLSAHLEHLAPASALARGFSIARNARGEILRDIASITPGDKLSVELANGSIDASVLGTRPKSAGKTLPGA